MNKNNVVDRNSNPNPNYKPPLGQRAIEMSDRTKGWLNALYTNEIAEVVKAIDNENVWLIASTNHTEVEMHWDNLMELDEYIKVLKKLKGELE